MATPSPQSRLLTESDEEKRASGAPAAPRAIRTDRLPLHSPTSHDYPSIAHPSRQGQETPTGGWRHALSWPEPPAGTAMAQVSAGSVLVPQNAGRTRADQRLRRPIPPG